MKHIINFAWHLINSSFFLHMNSHLSIYREADQKSDN